MYATDLANALDIILETQPDATVNTAHGVVYIGAYFPEEMSPEDSAALNRSGWFEQRGAWAHTT